MMLTINTLFNDPHIVSAVINRVLQTRDDTIYWQQYLSFRQTTTRVFKDYLGTVTGVRAGSINSRFGEKNIRERREIGYGYGEVAYLGDAYQMSVDRLSELQDLVDKFNGVRSEDQGAALEDIIQFIYDDYRQVLLAPHKRMDMVVGDLLMTGNCSIKNKDLKSDANAPEVLNISLPYHFEKPAAGDVIVSSKKMFITYLVNTMDALEASYGRFQKMVMSRKTFNKYVINSSEFNTYFKQQSGRNQFYLGTGLITSAMASEVFQSLGLPTIEIKSDYVLDANGVSTPVYADDRITLLNSDQIGYMRHHTPYELTDGVPGRNYTPADGQMLISNYRDKEGRYMEYTAEWIPQISAPDRIVNFDLSDIKDAF